jgi:hypothetical protein
MIISRKNKFIFVRVPKTGSTSAQATLINSGILGPDDIYSRYRRTADGFPPNSINIPVSINTKIIMEVSPYDISKELHVLKKIPILGGDGSNGLIGHLTPTEIVRLGLISPQELRDYTVIGSMREPIDRLISIWFLYNDIEGKLSSKQKLIKSIGQSDIYPITFLGKTQKNYFEYEGELLNNIKVLDFNNLNNDLRFIISKYGEKTADYHTFENQLRPHWSKEPYINWMPLKTIIKLNQLLKEDIEFYNQHVKT